MRALQIGLQFGLENILGASPNRFFVSHCSAKRSMLVSSQVRPVFNSCLIAPALSHWHQNLALRETHSPPSVVFLLWCKPVYNAVPSLKWNRELLAWMDRHIVFNFNLQIFFCSIRLAHVTVSAREQMGRDFYSGTSKWNLKHVASGIEKELFLTRMHLDKSSHVAASESLWSFFICLARHYVLGHSSSKCRVLATISMYRYKTWT